MATHKVTLRDGVKLSDGVAHRDVTLRVATVGDLLDAGRDSERLVQTSEGPALVVSEMEMPIQTLRRQIAALGSLSGPIGMEVMRTMSPADLQTLQIAALALEDADVNAEPVSKGTIRRGRAEGHASTPAG